MIKCKMPKVSIITVVYNGEKELEEGTTEYIAKLIRVEENVQLDEEPMLRKILKED